VCFSGQKLDEEKQDAVPEVFIDQDEVLAKVGKAFNIVLSGPI